MALTLSAGLFGGASQADALSLMVVELASLPLLWLAIHGLVTEGLPRGAIIPVVLLLAIVAIPALQLVPLPASVWGRLPGRAPEVQALALAHLGNPAEPFSLTPDATWRSLLALLPPAAMFLGAIRLPERQRRILAVLWLLLGLLSVVIGVLQILGGEDSPLYFYAVTNTGSPVGLFANRNHQAAFLYSLLPLAGAFAAEMSGGARTRQSLGPILGTLFIPVAIIGVAITDSRAGVVLTIAALMGVLVLALRRGAFKAQWAPTAVLSLAAAAGVAAVLLFGLQPLLNRFGALDRPELRFEGWPIVLKIAKSFLPLGSGIGSFDTVYRAAEPLTQVSSAYFNHAHDDWLEVWLEAGFAGVVIAALSLAWFFARAARIWTGRQSRQVRDLAAPCTVLILLLLVHSLVDYPTRTESIAVLFALAFAALITSPNAETASRSNP